MMKIHLSKLYFFAFHGIYEEERLLGNDFEVNIEVGFTPASLPVLHIKDTINYVDVYGLVKKRMSIPTALLETLATDIAIAILAQFSLAEQVFISIDKVRPPIEQFRGRLGVSFELKRNK
jgi:dihydroneopterin aldolase